MTVPVGGGNPRAFALASGSMSSIGERSRPAASRDKDHVLKKASDLIADLGFEQTRLIDVSREAGVAISTLQYAFGSREDLLIAALDHAHLEELRGLEEATSAEEDPWDRLRAYVAFAINGPRGDRGWLLWLEFWRSAKRIPRLGERSVEVQDRWVAILRDIIADGVERKTFRDIDPEEGADQVLAIVDGIGLAELLHGSQTNLVAAVQQAEEAARLLLQRVA